MQTAAIVTTVKHQGASLDTFIRYHLSIGFSRIYMMFDDPNDPDLLLAGRYSEVRCIPVDENLHRVWSTLNQFPRYAKHIDKEVRARQALNAEVALKMAEEENINWLLHIDGDELFWPGRSTIHDHLDALHRQKIRIARYFNFEGVPHQEKIEDYFLHVSAFKRPRKLLSKEGINVTDVWREKARYYNFYTNGKSMCRVENGMVSNDVHEWKHITEKIVAARFFYPAILHYSCCGYEFFRAKFRKHIGAGYTGSEFGVELKDKGFHLDYDALMAYRSGDEDLAKRLYRENIMLPPEKIQYYRERRLIENLDVAKRISIEKPN